MSSADDMNWFLVFGKLSALGSNEAMLYRFKVNFSILFHMVKELRLCCYRKRSSEIPDSGFRRPLTGVLEHESTCRLLALLSKSAFCKSPDRGLRHPDRYQVKRRTKTGLLSAFARSHG